VSKSATLVLKPFGAGLSRRAFRGLSSFYNMENLQSVKRQQPSCSADHEVICKNGWSIESIFRMLA